VKKTLIKLLLFIGIPFTYLSATWLKFVTLFDNNRISDKIFMKLGILPILDHYYQPMINPGKILHKSLREDRKLSGIDFNEIEQLELLSKFNYNAELSKFPVEKRNENEYFYNNKSFCSGDAEYLYNMVRHFKSCKIIEIGCGSSTLMIQNAIRQNLNDNIKYACQHFCIEPYEQPWLEKIEIQLLRERVENIDRLFFQNLEANDILFIDSSHIIRPQGDVLFEYLEILPMLKSGVLVHIHDIFTPKDYLNEWVYNHVLWNEQYLLEAFLTYNSEFRIIGALNFLSHHYRKEFAEKCPIFKNQNDREPGSFWMIRK